MGESCVAVDQVVGLLAVQSPVRFGGVDNAAVKAFAVSRFLHQLAAVLFFIAFSPLCFSFYFSP